MKSEERQQDDPPGRSYERANVLKSGYMRAEKSLYIDLRTPDQDTGKLQEYDGQLSPASPFWTKNEL